MARGRLLLLDINSLLKVDNLAGIHKFPNTLQEDEEPIDVEDNENPAKNTQELESEEGLALEDISIRDSTNVNELRENVKARVEPRDCHSES